MAIDITWLVRRREDWQRYWRLVTQETTCPFCYESFYLGMCAIRATQIDGSGYRRVPRPEPDAALLPAAKNPTFAARRRVHKLDGKRYTNLMAARLCPHCGNPLPYNIERMQSAVIGVIGGSGVSKSHYIAALLSQLKDGALKPLGCSQPPEAIDTIVDTRCDEEYLRPLMKKKLKIEPTPATSEFPGCLPLIYTLTFTEQRHWRIFTWHATRLINLVFYDAQGEQFEREQDILRYFPHVPNAQGLIFLIDPWTLPKARPVLEIRKMQKHDAVDRDPQILLDGIARIIRRSQKARDGAKVPVMVAFTIAKSDLLKYVAQDVLKEEFPPRLARDENLAEYDPARRSGLDDFLSKLVERSGGNWVSGAMEKFEQARLFAASATGNDLRVDGTYKDVTPIRVVHPLAWLLHELGHLPATRPQRQAQAAQRTSGSAASFAGTTPLASETKTMPLPTAEEATHPLAVQGAPPSTGWDPYAPTDPAVTIADGAGAGRRPETAREDEG